MLDKELCYIGVLGIQVTAPTKLLCGLRPFFSRRTVDAIETKIQIELHYASKPPINVDLETMQEFVLNSISYYWDKATETYYAYNEVVFGHIDVSQQKAVWYIYEEFDLMRNLFHLSILDTVSLLGTNYKAFILHSALVEIDNQGVAFAGLSGMGKSTLSYLIGKTETAYKVSDDTNMLVIRSGGVYISPINSGEGYLNTVLSEIDYHCDSMESIMSIDEKQYFFRNNKPERVYPLGLLVFLDKEHIKATEYFTLTATETLKTIVSLQTHIAGPYLEKWFKLVMAVALRTKAIRIVYEGKADVALLRKVINENLL